MRTGCYGPGAGSKNRIDQRMPLKFVTNFFLPSETSARSDEFKKTLSLAENQTVMFGTREAQVIQVDSICSCLEGLSFLMLSR